MTLNIRTLRDSPHTYLAYVSLASGVATYLLCFTDDILGAMNLHDFAEMLRKYFNLPEVDLAFRDQEVDPNSDAFLRLLSHHD